MRSTLRGASTLVLATACSVALADAPAPSPTSALPPSTVPTFAVDLTLPVVLAFAREHAPALIAARTRRGLATAAKAGVRGPLVERPVLEVATGPRWDAGDPGLDVQLALSQRVEIGGQRRARERAAGRLADRVEAEIAEVEGAVLVEVAHAYRSAALARAEVALAARREALVRETRGLVQRRVKGGEVAAVDAQIAEAEVAEAESAHALAEGRAEARERTLATQAGWSLEVLPPVAPAEPEALPPLEALLAAAPAPTVRAARAVAHEARARAQLAEWLNAPAPSFGVSVARESSSANPASWIVLATVALELPFTTPDPEAPARSRAESIVADAEADARESVARAELRSAYQSAVAARALVAQIERTVTTPLTARLAVLDRAYAAGELTLLDLATARARLFAADQARIEALAALAEALDQLERALGRPLASPSETTR